MNCYILEGKTRSSAVNRLLVRSEVSGCTQNDDIRTKYVIPADVRVIHPLTSELLTLVDADVPASITPESKTSDSISTVLISTLNHAILCSTVIWQMGGAAVLQISPDVALKRDAHLDVDHVSTLNHIQLHAPSLPFPRTFGVLVEAEREIYFHFMTYFPGRSLESYWPHLCDSQKRSVQEQLEPICRELRSVPPPPLENGRLTWGGGVPRRCKDTRRTVRVAPQEVLEEQAFNNFLTSSVRPAPGSLMEMVKPFMQEDHACVMTHSDLHPRNIVVQILPCNETDSNDDELAGKDIKVLGVIDWGKSGWYPEYWEFVNALRHIGMQRRDPMVDWWQYLPSTIGVWPMEYSLDLLIHRWYKMMT